MVIKVEELTLWICGAKGLKSKLECLIIFVNEKKTMNRKAIIDVKHEECLHVEHVVIL